MLPSSKSSDTTRVEAFSDAVFAIAITLLVLEVALPEDTENRTQLLEFLGGQWPSYISYVFGFLTIGAIWVNHHYIFRFISRVNQPFLFVNVLFLMLVAFMPWVTAVLASTFRSPEQRDLTVTLYLAVLVVMAWAFNAVWFSARFGGLLDESDREQIAVITKSYPAGAGVITLSFLLSLFSALAGLVLYLLLTGYYIFEGPEAQARRRERAA